MIRAPFLGTKGGVERVLMVVGMRCGTKEGAHKLSTQGTRRMRQLFSFLGHSSNFLFANDSEAKQASSLAVRSESILGQGVGSRLRRCKQADCTRRMISRKRKLLRRCLSLSLMAVGLSSTSAVAGVVKLDGTSGSNQVSPTIDTSGGGTEVRLGFYAQYLVIGGGGSGGSTNRVPTGVGISAKGPSTGGGGAGGFVEGSGKELSNQSYIVTVGGGGVAPSVGAGNNGGDSAFDDVTALGGGGGGGEFAAPKSGGSGGGASGGDGPARSGGTGTSGQGNAGAGNPANGTTQGGGGGGAGAPGSGVLGATRSDGGVGKASSITGSSVMYAGGGGGGAFDFAAARPGAGGAGGGGAGSFEGNGSNGTNGLGGGGGGVGAMNTSNGLGAGGRGGSGVVIVRYDGTQLVRPGGTAVGGTVTEGAGFTVHRFDAVGTSNFVMSDVDMNARLGAVVNSTITGAGDLSFSGPGRLTLNAANTHTGSTRAMAGILNMGNVDALQYSTLDMNSGDTGTVGLTLSGQSYNVGGLQGSRDLAIGNNSLNVGANNSSTNYSGNLSGTGGVSKVGTGTFDLSGANAYTGATDVAAGKLLVNGSTAGGAVTVQNSASLGGTGTLNGSTTFLSGSIHTPGNSPGLQTFTSGLTYNTGSTFEWELTSNTTTGRGTIFDAVDVSGSPLLIQSGVTSSLVFNGTGSTVDWTDALWGMNQSWLVFSSAAGITAGSPFFDTINVTNDSNGVSLAAARATAFFSWSRSGNDLILNYSAPVPEPTSMAIFGLGALGMAYRARRRGKAKAEQA